MGGHGRTLNRRAGGVGAAAHAGLRIVWRAPLATAAVGTMALAFALVVLDASQQSDQRRRAEDARGVAVAACEAWPTHQERTRCRAALRPPAREGASEASRTARSP